jgi:hypothetical protein
MEHPLLTIEALPPRSVWTYDDVPYHWYDQVEHRTLRALGQAARPHGSAAVVAAQVGCRDESCTSSIRLLLKR